MNELATLAGGCFWCTEALFKRLKGVSAVLPGYTGGIVPNPTYEDVCEGNTGHAEAIQITFDPSQIPYEKILEIFFHTHNPTTLNQQGDDRGTQYRSVIFYHDAAQREAAEQAKAAAQPRFSRPIVTVIEPAPTFWRAEEYHQRYVERTGQPSCHILRE